MPHPIDNPFWTALRELHGAFAQGAGEVLRYPPDIAPFVAIAHPGVAVDEALDALLPDREPAVMLGVAPAARSAALLAQLRGSLQHTLDALLDEIAPLRLGPRFASPFLG